MHEMDARSQFLYTLQAVRTEMLKAGPSAAEMAIVEQHFSYVQALAEQGTVLLAGRTQNNDESTFGIVILEADSEAAARDIMNADPAVVHGLMRSKLYPYRIAVKGIHL